MRKSYSDYPDQFFSILTHFESSDDPIHHSMIYREAISTRHSFYRFLAAIRRASDDGDTYATKLREVVRKLSISVTPVQAEPETPTDLCVYVAPLEIGRGRVAEPEPEQDEPEDVIPIDRDEIERIIADKKRK